jgi:predicted CXXCH cytochrome family protein
MSYKAKLKWLYWLAVSLLILSPVVVAWVSDDKSQFLPGETTHGHYQIEMSCSTCHTDGFGGTESLQSACMECHGAELKAARDSHPKSKFTDPRNADRLEQVDARYCISCHVEHNPEVTRSMGVTLQDDFCFKCHADVAEDRPSHQGMAFTTCSAGGCHNYHDNTALYEDFLLAHQDEPRIQAHPQIPATNTKEIYVAMLGYQPYSLTGDEANAPDYVKAGASIEKEWGHSQHAAAGVNCNDCHMDKQSNKWINKPTQQVCAQCHKSEVDGFLQGKHGMRLAQGLSPMMPDMARQPMHPDSMGKQLTCMSCHNDHSFNVKKAAVNSCMSCHNDEHTKNYENSPHHKLWQQEQLGQLPAGSGVSCASCHMPRETHKVNGQQAVRVQHNQNLNLRPNEKMIRGVCMQCHGYEFSANSLADDALILNNFNGMPKKRVESMEMVQQRQKSKSN